jgi:hypothetical protein
MEGSDGGLVGPPPGMGGSFGTLGPIPAAGILGMGGGAALGMAGWRGGAAGIAGGAAGCARGANTERPCACRYARIASFTR